MDSRALPFLFLIGLGLFLIVDGAAFGATTTTCIPPGCTTGTSVTTGSPGGQTVPLTVSAYSGSQFLDNVPVSVDGVSVGSTGPGTSPFTGTVSQGTHVIACGSLSGFSSNDTVFTVSVSSSTSSVKITCSFTAVGSTAAINVYVEDSFGDPIVGCIVSATPVSGGNGYFSPSSMTNLQGLAQLSGAPQTQYVIAGCNRGSSVRGITPFSQTTTTGASGSTDTVKVTITYQQFSIVGGLTGGALSGLPEALLGLLFSISGFVGLYLERSEAESQ